jgi:hypothetical protein
MKTLMYFKNKYEFSLTHTGRESAKINAEKNLKSEDYEKFLMWIELMNKYELATKTEKELILIESKEKLKDLEYEYFLKWTKKNPQKPKR